MFPMASGSAAITLSPKFEPSMTLLVAALAPILFNLGAAKDPTVATELFGSPEELARSLFTDFVLPFEIASVLLLVAIIGAVVLANKEP